MTTSTLRDFAPRDEAAARDLYEASFPPSLRAPWAALVAHRPDERLLTLADHRDDVIGFALIRHLGDTGMAFVRYLAVDPVRRGQGLGTSLVGLLMDLLREDGVGALLLDVETPIGAHADDDQRRIDFYVRCGLEVLDAPGYAPPEHGETGEVVPLLLMGTVLDQGPALRGPRLDEAVAAVLVHRYGVQA